MLEVKKIIIIEDSCMMRLLAKQILERAGFIVYALKSAEEYFANRKQYKDIGAILLDIHLPGMDGLAVLKQMNKEKTITWPPIIMFSGDSEKTLIRETLLLGARDYIIKPLSEEIFLQKINYVFENPSPKKFGERYMEMIQVVKEATECYRNSEFKNIPYSTIDNLVEECTEFVRNDEIMMLFDRENNMEDYSFHHSVNVAILSGIVGKWMGFKEKYIHDLVLTGLLHDLGKVKIPRELLYKSGKISYQERKLLKTHVIHSYDLINHSGFSKEVLLGVLQHHERIDGSGYPQGLLGKEICMAGRIVAIADIYDAMISNKIYSKAENPFEVIEELFREMFDKLDPHICAVFLKNIKERLVGQVFVLADGSKAKVVSIEEHGFAAPVLRTQDGKKLDNVRNLNIVGFINGKSEVPKKAATYRSESLRSSREGARSFG